MPKIFLSNAYHLTAIDLLGGHTHLHLTLEELIEAMDDCWEDSYVSVTADEEWPFNNTEVFDGEYFSDDVDELKLAFEKDQLEPYCVYLNNNHCKGCDYRNFKEAFVGNFGNKKDFVLQQIELRQKLEDADLLGLIHHIDFDSYFDNELSVDYWESDDYYFHNY